MRDRIIIGPTYSAVPRESNPRLARVLYADDRSPHTIGVRGGRQDGKETWLMRVMVIGASSDRSKFGNKSVRAHVRGGHEVFPVHPREEVVEGLRCYRTIAEVPGPIDRATIYVPPRIGVGVMAELAARGDVAQVWLNPGAESPEVLDAAAKVGITPIQACSIIDIGERP